MIPTPIGMRMRLGLSLVWALIAVAVASQAVVAGDTLIVPGERIGEFRLGEMAPEDVQLHLGAPSKTGQTCMGIIHEYDTSGLRCYFNPKTRKLNRIRTLNSSYQTESGLKTGVDVADARSEFSGTTVPGKGIYDCEKEGITFYYSMTTNRIVSISVNTIPQ